MKTQKEIIKEVYDYVSSKDLLFEFACLVIKHLDIKDKSLRPAILDAMDELGIIDGYNEKKGSR